MSPPVRQRVDTLLASAGTGAILFGIYAAKGLVDVGWIPFFAAEVVLVTFAVAAIAHARTLSRRSSPPFLGLAAAIASVSMAVAGLVVAAVMSRFARGEPVTMAAILGHVSAWHWICLLLFASTVLFSGLIARKIRGVTSETLS
jgi:hypothetical protein